MKKTIKKLCLYLLLENIAITTIFLFGGFFQGSFPVLRSFYDILLTLPKAIGICDFFDIRTHNLLIAFSSAWIVLFIASLPITFLAHAIYLAIAYMHNKDLSHHNDK